MTHLVEFDHPLALADLPLTLLACLWEDAVTAESDDAAALLEAWHAVPLRAVR